MQQLGIWRVPWRTGLSTADLEWIMSHLPVDGHLVSRVPMRPPKHTFVCTNGWNTDVVRSCPLRWWHFLCFGLWIYNCSQMRIQKPAWLKKNVSPLRNCNTTNKKRSSKGGNLSGGQSLFTKGKTVSRTGWNHPVPWQQSRVTSWGLWMLRCTGVSTVTLSWGADSPPGECCLLSTSCVLDTVPWLSMHYVQSSKQSCMERGVCYSSFTDEDTEVLRVQRLLGEWPHGIKFPVWVKARACCIVSPCHTRRPESVHGNCQTRQNTHLFLLPPCPLPAVCFCFHVLTPHPSFSLLSHLNPST